MRLKLTKNKRNFRIYLPCCSSIDPDFSLVASAESQIVYEVERDKDLIRTLKRPFHESSYSGDAVPLYPGRRDIFQMAA